MTTEATPAALRLTDGLGAGAEGRFKCRACGDHTALRVQRMECNSCGCALTEDWGHIQSTPIEKLLAQYAAECSDFSGRDGFEFALRLARQFAQYGPDSQMRCVVHTLLAHMDAPNNRIQPRR